MRKTEDKEQGSITDEDNRLTAELTFRVGETRVTLPVPLQGMSIDTRSYIANLMKNVITKFVI